MLFKLYILIYIYHLIINVKCVSYAEVEKFGSAMIRAPDTSGKIFFYLDITDFSMNQEMYLQFTSEEKGNLEFYYGYVSIINPSTQSISSFEKISEVIHKDENANRIYYFTIKKKSDTTYLAFYIQINGAFKSRVVFENTEEDESKEALKSAIIGLIVGLVGIALIVFIVILICRCCKKSKENSQIVVLQQQNQQIPTTNYELKPKNDVSE